MLQKFNIDKFIKDVRDFRATDHMSWEEYIFLSSKDFDSLCDYLAVLQSYDVDLNYNLMPVKSWQRKYIEFLGIRILPTNTEPNNKYQMELKDYYKPTGNQGVKGL